jgi:hypothetical protein
MIGPRPTIWFLWSGSQNELLQLMNHLQIRSAVWKLYLCIADV